MKKTSIKVQNVSKIYSVRHNTKENQQPSLLNKIFANHNNSSISQHVALKDINFELNKGEAVGVIGHNGAGKSTLLQIISGILSPDEGKVVLAGQITALLELGTAFSPEFTGRENVELACSILGMSDKKIKEKLAEIEAFADIGNFFDMPLKTYSTGMAMRLAFAANSAVEPDVLIVDEVLSVGDAQFQAKCFRRLNKLLTSGTTLLLVSHDIGTVRSICHRAIWLEKGQMKMIGQATKVCDEYQKYNSMKGRVETTKIAPNDELEKPTNLSKPTKLKESHINHLETKIEGYGTKALEILEINAYNKSNPSSQTFEYGDYLKVSLKLRSNNKIASEFIVGLVIRDITGKDILSCNNFNQIKPLDLVDGENIELAFELPIKLTHQVYATNLALFGFEDGVILENGIYDYSRAIIWHYVEECFFFEVIPNIPIPLGGPVHFPIIVKMNNL